MSATIESVMAAVSDLPEDFRLRFNVKQLAYLFSRGTVKGERVTFNVQDLLDMETTRTRSGTDEITENFHKLLTLIGAGELPDGIGAVSASLRQVLAAGFPQSAVKNLNYWRAPQSAAARVVISEGWVPSISTKLDESSGTLAVTVSFKRGPAQDKALAKLVAAHAEWQAEQAAKDAATDDASEASADDSDAPGEE